MRGLYPNDVTKSPIASLTRESSSMIEIMEAFIKSVFPPHDYLIRARAGPGNKIVKQQEIMRYYLRSVPTRFPARNSQTVGRSDQFGKRPCAKLLHDIVAMNFHGHFTNSDLSCGLLVHQARGHQCHDLALARAKRSVFSTQGL